MHPDRGFALNPVSKIGIVLLIDATQPTFVKPFRAVHLPVDPIANESG